MSEIEKTVYVCKTGLLATKSEEGLSAFAPYVEYNDAGDEATATVYVQKVGADFFDILKTVCVQKTGTVCPCVDPDLVQTEIDFSFDSVSEEVPNLDTPEPSDTLTETTFDQFPTISFTIPQTCLLVATFLDAMGPVDRVTIAQVYATNFDCVANNSGYSEMQEDCQIIPGMKMQLIHFLDCASPGNVIDGPLAYWMSCSLFGGIITAINGDYEDINHYYTVQLQNGKTFDYYPTDWIQWRVDDWVTLLTVGGNGETLNNKGNIDWTVADKLMIAPFYFGKYPVNAGMEHESVEIDLGDNSRMMHLRNVPATITAIDEENNQATVETTEFGTLTEVDFLWHCPDSVDTAGAWQAYEVNDVVNLVIPGVAYDAHLTAPVVPPTPYIIGWQSRELRVCSSYLYFFYDPTICYDAEEEIIDCGHVDRVSSVRFFDCFEYRNTIQYDKEITKDYSVALPINTLLKAGAGEIDSEHGGYNVTGHWSKTVGKITAHAFSYIIPGASPILKWAVFVEVNGRKYTFKPDINDESSYKTLWPEVHFEDRFWCDNNVALGNYTPVKAFDLFVLEDAVAGYGWEIGDTILSAYGNKISVELWNITKNDYRFKAIPIYTEITTDYPSENDAEYRTIALGVDAEIVYIAYATMVNMRMVSFDDVYAFDVFTGIFTHLNESGSICLFNPFLGEIWFDDFGETETENTKDIVETSRDRYGTPPWPDSGCALTDAICDTTIDTSYGRNFVILESYQTPWETVCNPGNRPYCDGCYPDDCNCYITQVDIYLDTGIGTKTERLGGAKTVGKACTGTKMHAGHLPGQPCGDVTYVDYTSTWAACPAGTIYSDWPSEVGANQGCITPEGTGARVHVTLQNGVENASENTVTETETDLDFGDVDIDYVLTTWPYLQNYAIAENVKDYDLNTYVNIFALENNDGHIIFDEGDLGEYLGVFQFYPTNLEVQVD